MAFVSDLLKKKLCSTDLFRAVDLQYHLLIIMHNQNNKLKTSLSLTNNKHKAYIKPPDEQKHLLTESIQCYMRLF